MVKCRSIKVLYPDGSKQFDFTGKITKLRKTVAVLRKLEKKRQKIHKAVNEGKLSVWSTFHSIDEPIYDKQNSIVREILGWDFGGDIIQHIYDDCNGDVLSSLEVLLDTLEENKEEVWL